VEIAYQDPRAFDILPFYGEFRNNAVEENFLAHNLDQEKSQLRISLIFCSVFYVAFALSDIATLGYTSEVLTLFLARSLVAVAAALAIYLNYRRPSSLKFPALAGTAVEVVGMGAFMLIAFYRHAEMTLHGMSMAIMLIVVYLFIPNRLIYSFGVALCTTAIFLLIALKVGNLKTSDIFTMSMLLVLTNAFGWVASRRHHILRRDEFRAQYILKQQAVLDHLTGCYNRRHLHDHLLQQEIARAQRKKLWLTVILCDLDNFKLINDTYGHQVGDAVLCNFSTLLHKMTRRHIDCVVRYGGEEFLLVIPETDQIGGVDVAERLRVAFAASSASGAIGQTISMTASFGVVAVNFAGVEKIITQSELISSADGLLYEAKKAGRNYIKSGQL